MSVTLSLFRGRPRVWTEAGLAGKVAMILGVALASAAILAHLLTPFEPNAQSLIARLRPPVGFERAVPGHILGTDELGRDVLTRSLHGLRLTTGLALIGATIGLFIGGTIGLVAGMAGGRMEAALMAVVDVQISVPFTLIALLVLAVFGSSLPVLIFVLGLNGWEQYARIVRAEVRRLMTLPFMDAARLAGASHRAMAREHVLPNIVSPLVVQFTLSLASIILLESTLSFLGLGVQPPTATLGSMVGVGRNYLATAPWITLAPAFFILAVVFVIQILGDWLRDRSDIRLRGR
jgi:peptide/nickel transport system permease protein